MSAKNKATLESDKYCIMGEDIDIRGHRETQSLCIKTIAIVHFKTPEEFVPGLHGEKEKVVSKM